MAEGLPIVIPACVTEILKSIPRSRPVIVGVSGGRDSMLLLHLLLAAGFRKVSVAHLDHGLRGKAATADARMVKKFATRLGFDFIHRKVDIREIAKANNVGLEEAGRDARWELFSSTARETGSRILFLGHHADDRAETLLHHLFRGAGLSGATSLRADRVLTMNRLKIRVVRPLLHLHREQIDGLVTRHAIAFGEDASNASQAHTRNRFRHQILPYLESTYGRPIRSALARTARILEAEDEWMNQQAEATLAKFEPPELRAKPLFALPLALRRRVIRLWLRQQKVQECGFAEIEAIAGMLEVGAPAKINLPGNLHARRRQGRIYLEKGKAA